MSKYMITEQNSPNNDADDFLHFKDDSVGFILFCGLGVSEVSFWTYLNLYKESRPFGEALPREHCPVCAEWINLDILAEAEL